MKRTTTLIAALIASAGLALAGCGGGDDAKKDGGGKTPAKTDGDKKGAADTKKGEEKTAKTITFKCSHSSCGKTKPGPEGSTQIC